MQPNDNQQLEQILGDLPEEQRSTVVSMLIERSSSPLPPPELIDYYEQKTPGAAERILRMAEKEQDHRHFLVKSNLGQAKLGAWFGFAVFLLLILSILAATSLNNTTVAVALCGVGVAGIVGHFVNSHKDNQ